MTNTYLKRKSKKRRETSETCRRQSSELIIRNLLSLLITHRPMVFSQPPKDSPRIANPLRSFNRDDIIVNLMNCPGMNVVSNSHLQNSILSPCSSCHASTNRVNHSQALGKLEYHMVRKEVVN